MSFADTVSCSIHSTASNEEGERECEQREKCVDHIHSGVLILIVQPTTSGSQIFNRFVFFFFLFVTDENEYPTEICVVVHNGCHSRETNQT